MTEDRTHARRQAVWNYFNGSPPTMVSWSADHGHLREMTGDDL